MKLHLLSKCFGDSFTHVYDIIALTHNHYFDSVVNVNPEEKSKELQAIEVYRNKIEGIKAFAININSTKGI